MFKDKTTNFNKCSLARLRSLIMSNSFKAGIVKNVSKGYRNENIKIISTYLSKNGIISKHLMQLNKSELIVAYRTIVVKNGLKPRRALLCSFSLNYFTL